MNVKNLSVIIVALDDVVKTMITGPELGKLCAALFVGLIDVLLVRTFNH